MSQKRPGRKGDPLRRENARLRARVHQPQRPGPVDRANLALAPWSTSSNATTTAPGPAFDSRSAYIASTELSPVTYSFSGAEHSWLELPTGYQQALRSGHRGALELAEGNMAFYLTRSAASSDLAHYSLWNWVLTGYFVSAAMVALLLACLAIVQRRHKKPRRLSDPAST
ncbi:MAG: hypothetical protein M1115_03105 [Actinobacteria bacterium]|nr:hypothetical protein [Actinomycetota bacterium]